RHERSIGKVVGSFQPSVELLHFMPNSFDGGEVAIWWKRLLNTGVFVLAAVIRIVVPGFLLLVE
ncbi:MAG: hypothetical protein DRQ54_10435, partial [Gammaproteobacteria bacterium]